MAECLNIFAKLSEYYGQELTWEEVEELYDAAKSPDGTQGQEIVQLPIVQRALDDKQVFSTIMDLSGQIRSLRTESNVSYDNTYDCWDKVVKVSPRDNYLTFIYALAGLSSLPNATIRMAKVSLAAANAYFLSLTIPGAKGFEIFQEDVIIHCLQVFGLVQCLLNPLFTNNVSKQKVVEVWVRFVTFCDDLKLLLRYVHLEGHVKIRNEILKRLLEIQYINHERGFANVYTVNLHAKCFEIFEEMINAHNGEPEDTLRKLMHMTLYLHTHPAKPKNNVGGVGTGTCEHISDWFIKSISKYPGLLAKVLKHFIEFVVTNPIKTWKSDQLQRVFEYAAKYDAALFTKCNESCVSFLSEAIYADEVVIRARSIELISRILQVESHVDWQMFRHEVSDIPREVHLIKELIQSLRDSSNNIRLKAGQALMNILTNGSPTSKKIMTEGIRFAQYNEMDVCLPEEPRVLKNEIRFSKPSTMEPKYSYQGHNLVEEEFLLLPNYIYKYMLQCDLAFIRRAGLQLLDQVVRINPIVIFNTHFVEEISRLMDETSILVRKATLQCLDSLLASYPNCYPLIWVWCKLIAPMLHDNDAKNVEMAMECFSSRVLKNLKGIDKSNMAEHFMPWVIIRTLLSTQSRLYLQTCFHLALQRNMITPQILSIIESHLLTSNSTEAWILLNFVSGKIKSKEPDSLIHMFISLNSWNKEQNTYIALEVLANCISHFSPAALNLAFTHILTGIENGSMLPVLIGKAFDLLMHISTRSQRQHESTGNKGSVDDEEWLLKLHEKLELSILNEVSDFNNNRSTLLSHLYSYSEVNMQIRMRPHASIVNFAHKYMSECIKQSVSEWNLENERLFNSVILVAGRFSLRDAAVADKTIQLYSVILDHIDRPQIVNTVIVALADLCKKHTQMVEAVLDKLLHKLCSPYAVNRVETFKCFERLLLQDQLKLRGSILLGLLISLLDETPDLCMRASEFFDEFCAKKNPLLFTKCLSECPFVFNQYENFEGIESYGGAGKDLTSPLFGEDKRPKREQLYNHLISKIDDINLLVYFGQLKLLAEKSSRDPLLKTEKGLAVVKDVIFILGRICEVIKEQKVSSEQKPDDGTAEADSLFAALESDTVAVKADGAAANSAAGPGRGRRKREVTMPEALDVLEKSLAFVSKIYLVLNPLDPTIHPAFDEFCKALAKRFPDLVDFAVPKEFWQKYRKYASNLQIEQNKQKKANKKSNNETETSKSKRGRKSKNTTDEDGTSEDEGISPTRKKLNSIEKSKKSNENENLERSQIEESEPPKSKKGRKRKNDAELDGTSDEEVISPTRKKLNSTEKSKKLNENENLEKNLNTSASEKNTSTQIEGRNTPKTKKSKKRKNDKELDGTSEEEVISPTRKKLNSTEKSKKLNENENLERSQIERSNTPKSKKGRKSKNDEELDGTSEEEVISPTRKKRSSTEKTKKIKENGNVEEQLTTNNLVEKRRDTYAQQIDYLFRPNPT